MIDGRPGKLELLITESNGFLRGREKTDWRGTGELPFLKRDVSDTSRSCLRKIFSTTGS